MANQNFNSPDFEKAKDLLNKLFEEVKSKESELAGGDAQDLQRGATAVQRLRETKVIFGDPRSRLIPLTVEGFTAQKIELDNEIEQLMKQYDFYLMVVSIEPKLKPNVLISKLECNLDFSGQDNQNPLVHRIIPDSKWQSLINAGVTLNMGLDASLDIGVGVDASELTKIANLPDYAKFKANVGTKDEFKAFLVLDGLNYKLGKFNIFAQGEDNSQCYWRLEKPEIQDKSSIKFNIIFKVPKGLKSIDLVGKVWVEPDIYWLNSELKEIKKDLSCYLKNIFGNKKKASESFAVGQQETWNIKLPQA